MNLRKKLIAKGMAVILTGSMLAHPVQAEVFDNSGYIEGRASELQEPFYHSSKPVEYSYVYFGSYPQSEVTGEALTPAVTSAVYDAYGDAQIGKDKYRMVEKDGSRRYFRYEPIRWQVVWNVYGEAYLMADSVLDCSVYQYGNVKKNWNDGDLYRWLNCADERNKGFYQTAFSEQEQRDIKNFEITNVEDGQSVCVSGAVVVPNLGNGDYEKIYISGEGQGRRASAYAQMRAGKTDDYGMKWWCGRAYEDHGLVYAPYVDENGIWQKKGLPADTENIGICPVIIVSTKEDALWKSEREVQLEQETVVYDKDKAAAVHSPKKENGNISFSYIYMGSYPQSEVTGEALTEEIRQAFSAASGDAVNGAAVRSDVLVGETRYRCVQEEDGAHYYRFEPICWRVVYVNNTTKKAFLLAEKILDYNFYNKDGNTDERCSKVLQWLNSYSEKRNSYGEAEEGFLKEAFEDKGESLKTVWSGSLGESVKITMMESWDIRKYLEASDKFPTSAIGIQTAYAASKCEGEEAETPANWWMLTESRDLVFADYVDKKGIGHTDGLTMGHDGFHYQAYTDDATIGVRPAVILDLTKTDVWEPAQIEQVEYPYKEVSGDDCKKDDKTEDGKTEEKKDDEKKDEHQTVDDEHRKPGDINGDGNVTLEDAAFILKAALKIVTLPEEVKVYADMDGNGRIELADAQFVLRKALKID